MNIFLNEEELVEIKPLDPTEDKGTVINPTVGKREEANSNLQKEIVALDSLIIGPSAAAQISGVSQSSASKYKDAKDISDPDVRARINQTRYEIEDVATAKLMETLNIINPYDCEKPRDKIALVTGLSSLLDKISPKERESAQQVHLHLYGPTQKKESQYETIDV